MSDQGGYRPSNGTEGSYFRDANCYVCIADHDFHDGGTEGYPCPILNEGFMAYPGPGPDQWVREDRDAPYPGARCTAFAGICACAPTTQIPEIRRFHQLESVS